MLYCPECLSAGYPEDIFQVPVPFKLGISNRNGQQWQSEAAQTQLASAAAVEHIYLTANGWKKHAAIYTLVSHVTLLYALVIWFLLHDSVSHSAYLQLFTTCYL